MIKTNNFIKENSRQNIVEFEQEKVHLQSYPQVLFIELTENCNFSCDMCRSAGIFDKSKIMSFDLFERIANELFDKAKLIDLRGWGESTILKDFRKYVDYASKYQAKLRIVTNLSVSNESLWEYLLQKNVLISVSFDAFKPETFHKLRRGSNYKQIVKNLKLITKYNHQLGYSPENIQLIVTVQKSALQEIPDIVRLASDLGIERITLQAVHLPPQHPEHLSNCETDILASLAKTQRISDDLNLETRLGTALSSKYVNQLATFKRCTHPWMYLYVNYLGQIGYCDHLIGAPAKKYLLGDLRYDNFKDVWNGDIYTKLRQQHLDWKTNELSTAFDACNWCYANRYIDIDDFSYPPYQQLVVSNKNQKELY